MEKLGVVACVFLILATQSGSTSGWEYPSLPEFPAFFYSAKDAIINYFEAAYNETQVGNTTQSEPTTFWNYLNSFLQVGQDIVNEVRGIQNEAPSENTRSGPVSFWDNLNHFLKEGVRIASKYERTYNETLDRATQPEATSFWKYLNRFLHIAQGIADKFQTVFNKTMTKAPQDQLHYLKVADGVVKEFQAAYKKTLNESDPSEPGSIWDNLKRFIEVGEGTVNAVRAADNETLEKHEEGKEHKEYEGEQSQKQITAQAGNANSSAESNGWFAGWLY